MIRPPRLPQRPNALPTPIPHRTNFTIRPTRQPLLVTIILPAPQPIPLRTPAGTRGARQTLLFPIHTLGTQRTVLNAGTSRFVAVRTARTRRGTFRVCQVGAITVPALRTGETTVKAYATGLAEVCVSKIAVRAEGAGEGGDYSVFGFEGFVFVVPVVVWGVFESSSGVVVGVAVDDGDGGVCCRWEGGGGCGCGDEGFRNLVPGVYDSEEEEEGRR